MGGRFWCLCMCVRVDVCVCVCVCDDVSERVWLCVGGLCIHACAHTYLRTWVLVGEPGGSHKSFVF